MRRHIISKTRWNHGIKHSNMSKCVCVCASNAKMCKLGQSVKTHNHIMFQNQRNMIIPTTFVFNGIQRGTHKYLRDMLSWTWYAQHNTKHNTMHKNDAQTCKTCRIGIILTKPTKPINQTQQNINKTIFNHRIFITHHKHKIQEN